MDWMPNVAGLATYIPARLPGRLLEGNRSPRTELLRRIDGISSASGSRCRWNGRLVKNPPLYWPHSTPFLSKTRSPRASQNAARLAPGRRPDWGAGRTVAEEGL